MPLRDSFQRLNVAGLAPQVHTNDAGCFGSNQFFDTSGIDCVGTRVDVAKHGSKAEPLHGVSGADESERGYDYFAAHLEGPHGQLKTGRGVAHGLAMAGPEVLLKLFFQFFNARAIVAEPASLERVADSFQQPVFVPYVGTSDMQDVLKARLPAKDREIFYRFL